MHLNGYSCKIYTRTHNPLVMVRIDANCISFKVKSVLTILDLLEFIFMKIWVSPDSRIYHMWKPFPPGNL